jgi:F-type H+-transporting ATPase subunit b
MLIDWLTVVAQIVNFLILVGLMRRFLYKPLLTAIDTREAHTAAQLAEADAKNREAELKFEQIQARSADLERRREQMIDDAMKDADRQKTELLQTARQSVDAMEAKWRADLRREESVFFDEIRHEAATEILSIARRALADLASTEVEHGAVETLLGKLKKIDAVQWQKLSAHGLTVVSAQELPADLRLRIQQAVDTRAGVPLSLLFERSHDMSWGLELRGDGQRIGWTPDSYVDSLEEKLKGIVDART